MIGNKFLSVAGASAPTDAQFNYVTMLLHGDGTNGAQNNTFLDSSTNNFTITRNGNTTQGSFSPYGSNWSNYFDGSGDYLSVANNAALNVLGGSFTLECWFCLTATQKDAGLVSKHDGSGGYILRLDTTFIRFFTSAATVDRTYSFSTGVWYHVAVVSNGTTGTLYVNGVAQGATFTTNGTNATTALQIGRTNTVTNDFPGYISNVRLTNTVVYSGNFTPSTTSLTAVSGTALLTCQSNRYIDNSSNAFAITVNGDTRIQRFNPFGTSTAYSTATIGGSGYFDGTGDYLSAAANAAFQFGTGNFCIEYWYYPTSFPTYTTTINSGYTSGGGYVIQAATDGKPYFYTGGATLITSTTAYTLNAWNHFAVCRSGTTLSMFINGVRVGTTTDSTNYNLSAELDIGIGSTYPIYGYMGDVRLVKGASVYTPSSTTITVPTAPLTAIANTSLLLNMTNGAIYDNAMMNGLETVGNAQISTSVKKYGTGSISFNGSTDYLAGQTTPNLAFGTGDFTVEGWFYQTADNTYPTALEIGNHLSSTGIVFITKYSGNATIYSGGFYATKATTLNAWNHIAWVRASGVLTIYVNGVGGTGVAFTNNLTDTTTVRVGATANGSPLSNYVYAGYIDDLRITKGYARYTSNFTPPTAALPDKGPISS